MSDNRVELGNKELDNVMGGLSYDPEAKTVFANSGGTVYHYDSQSAIDSWMYANYKNYAGWDPDKRDNDMLQKLLAAGIIHQ